MASEDFLIRLSVVFKKFGLVSNEFFLLSVSFSMSASSTLALNFIFFTLAIKLSMAFRNRICFIGGFIQVVLCFL